MVELREFGKLGPRITFEAEEGDRTMETLDGIGGETTGPVYSNKIMPGNYVKLIGDMRVENCDAGDTLIIGQAITKPTHRGMQPTAPALSGDYERRKLTVEVAADKISMVTLEPANAEIEAGDSLVLGANTAQTWDKSVAATNVIALIGADANTGAKIPVALGFKG
jgi:hypothetical protein